MTLVNFVLCTDLNVLHQRALFTDATIFFLSVFFFFHERDSEL